MTLRLYTVHGILRDYTPGMATVIATSPERVLELLREEFTVDRCVNDPLFDMSLIVDEGRLADIKNERIFNYCYGGG